VISVSNTKILSGQIIT